MEAWFLPGPWKLFLGLVVSLVCLCWTGWRSGKEFILHSCIRPAVRGTSEGACVPGMEVVDGFVYGSVWQAVYSWKLMTLVPSQAFLREYSFCALGELVWKTNVKIGRRFLPAKRRFLPAKRRFYPNWVIAGHLQGAFSCECARKKPRRSKLTVWRRLRWL